MLAANIRVALERNRGALIFFSAWVIGCFRLLYQSSYFPAYFAGEESDILNKCADVFDSIHHGQSWLDFFCSTSTEYNKGFYWMALPFYAHFGYDFRIVIYLVNIVTGFFCAGFFLIYYGSNPRRTSLACFILAIGFSLLALCVRRYKWHGLSYPAVFSVYLFLLPHLVPLREKLHASAWRAVGLVLYCLSCFLYFGNIIFALPLLGFSVWLDFPGKTSGRTLFVCLAGLAIAGFGAVAHQVNSIFADRMAQSLTSAYELFTPTIGQMRMNSIGQLVGDYFSLPMLAVFGTGLVFSWRRIREGDRFCVINLIMLCWTLAIQLLMDGVSNPDALNWSMLPMIGVLLVGADALYSALQRRYAYGSAIFFTVAVLMAGNEFRYFPLLNRDAYYQQCILPEDTTTQAALVLRLIAASDAGETIYYLPHPSIPKELGGFVYGNNLKREDFKEALARIVFFTNAADLRDRLAAGRNHPAIAYLSVPKKEPYFLSDALAGYSRPVTIHPYEDIYKIRFPVRQFIWK